MLHFNDLPLKMISLPVSAAEFLLTAPPACTKVYLYGLLRKEAELEQIAHELSLSRSEVLDAIDCLQSEGLIQISTDAYTQVLYRPKEPEAAPPLEIYGNANFNACLQALFADRELSYRDYKIFYECVDVYGLSEQVVLILAEYCINSHKAKNRVPISYIRENARQWAKEGITTMELATQKVYAKESAQGGAREVLRLLRINKLPSEEEEKLYEKWTGEWGFSFGAIKASLAATTRAQYPTMKYLDGILKNLHALQKHSAQEVSDHLLETEQMDANIKELLVRISSPRLTVSPDYRLKYLRWRNMGFGQEEMAFACSYAMDKGAGNLEYVDKLLAGWQAMGLLHKEDILSHLQKAAEVEQGVHRMLATAGLKKQVSRADQDLYRKFTEKYGFSQEVVLFAAECAYGLASPLKAMDKILTRWRDAGVQDLAQARQENARFRAASHPATSSTPRFIERNYGEGELKRKVHDPISEMEEREHENA